MPEQDKDTLKSSVRKKPLPLDFRPMMTKSTKQPFDDSDWIFEIKWDGYRAIAVIRSPDVDLLSRNGLSLKTKFAPVVQALKKLKVETAILDGEIVVLDNNGIPRFELLQRYMRNPTGELIYVVFDLTYLNGEDLTGVPLVRRRELLRQVLPEKGPIRFSEAIDGQGKEFFRLAQKRGFEGIIAKRKDSPYLPGRRSGCWLKIKARMQQEAVIGGITKGSGSRKYFGALMLGVYEKGHLRYVGDTGTGFSNALLKEVFNRLKPYFTDTCPFEPPPKVDVPVQWVKPKLVCEVAFQEWTAEGKMRQSAFLGLRDDKDPKEVIRET